MNKKDGEIGNDSNDCWETIFEHEDDCDQEKRKCHCGEAINGYITETPERVRDEED